MTLTFKHIHTVYDVKMLKVTEYLTEFSSVAEAPASRRYFTTGACPPAAAKCKVVESLL